LAGADHRTGSASAASYTNLTDADRATGLQLARRPHDSANLLLTWQALEDLNIGLKRRLHRFAVRRCRHFTKLGETGHLNLLAAYKLGDGFELFGRIENLSDNGREPVAGYGVPGRAFFGGIRTKI
jgi:vitamin B12 transporter